MQNVKKRIVVKDIEGIKGKRYANYVDEFDYLINSGIANEVKSVSTPVYPLCQTQDKNLLTLYMNDVGLLSNLLFRFNTKPILETVRSINLGALYETVVASQLKALDHNLFYYDNRNNGEVDFSRHQSNLLAEKGEVPHTVDTGAHSTVHLPDSFAVGLAYKPLDNLSFEVGTVFTRWSSYDSLNIYFDSDYQSLNQKGWRDGWNFNASVEYEPLDWLALRAGIWHETPVTNESHADFMIPSYGRTGVGLGAGFTWENWTLDLAYAHLWVYDMDYGTTDAGGIRSAVSNIKGGNSRDTVANIYSVTVGYTF